MDSYFSDSCSGDNSSADNCSGENFSRDNLSGAVDKLSDWFYQDMPKDIVSKKINDRLD